MKRKALKTAFPYTLPILAGFWFLGMAYGIYMNTSGFPFYYPMLNISAYLSLGASLLCLWLFGKDSFLVPTMLLILAALTLLRKPLEPLEP